MAAFGDFSVENWTVPRQIIALSPLCSTALTNIVSDFYAHSSRIREESRSKVLDWWVQSTDWRFACISGYEVQGPISNGEASGWASHAEGGNVGQAPVAYG